jgi:hypothetical protein
MERIIFVNGKYHSTFNIFDLNSFKASFAINNGLEESEVSICKLPTAQENEQLLQAKNEGGRVVFVNNTVKALKIEDNEEVVILEFPLEQE